MKNKNRTDCWFCKYLLDNKCKLKKGQAYFESNFILGKDYGKEKKMCPLKEYIE